MGYAARSARPANLPQANPFIANPFIARPVQLNGGIDGTSETGGPRFEGVVKALIDPVGLKPGFGFVSCDQTMAAYGDDVFLHSSQMTYLQIGTKVSFEVKVNPKGKPQ